jgi:hypothetical protein
VKHVEAKDAAQVMLETARIQNQNACIAEDRINEESAGFNHPYRRSSVGATTNLHFSGTSYDTPGATARHHRENHSQLPPYLSAAYTMIEVKGEGDCLPLSVAYHIYSSTSADAGLIVRKEVGQFMVDNFQVYGNTLARDRNELIENLRRGRWLGEEFLNAAANCYNAQFTVYWHGVDDPARPLQYTSNDINYDPSLKAILWMNNHFTPLVLKGRSGASSDRYRTHSVSSSSGFGRQSTAGSSNAISTTSKNSASKKSGSRHHHQYSTSKSGTHRHHYQSVSKNSHRNSASKRSHHRRKASKSQIDHDSGTDSISTGSSMGSCHHNHHYHSSESKSGKHRHRSASKSHQDPPKSQHHHDSRKDIIINRRPYVDDRHLHSSVSKSESHHLPSRSATKIRHDPPASTSRSKAESDFDGSAILRGVLSDHSSYQSSNRHTSPGGTSEYAEYIPDDIIVNIDAAPSDNMPKTPSTKGSIIDQIGSLGSHFTRLVFSATPNPASLETSGDVPSAIVSTTSGSRHHPPSTTHHQNRRHPSTAGTAPHDLDPTTHDSHHPRRRRRGPSPSAYSRQTEKAHNNNAEESSVAATRGNRTKKGIRKVDY